MAKDEQKTAAAEGGEDEAPRHDPVVPIEAPPSDVPGTEAGVRAELEGTARFVGYADIDRINQANKIKNQGVQAELPPWTVASRNRNPVRLRLLHFGVGTVRAMQGDAAEDVRKALSWPRNQDLPRWGTIETNARTMVAAVVGCTSGDAVDVDGAVRANRYRNAGICYIFPSSLLPGVRVWLRHLGHPYISVVEADVTEELKEKMGVRRSKPLPDYARAEVERVMVLSSIIRAEGTVVLGGKQVDLSKMATHPLRGWFEGNLLRAADLRGRVPTDPVEREGYFATMYQSQNPDVLSAFLEAHERIRTAENDEILARGDDFKVGADWDYERGSAVYEAQADPVDLSALDVGPLRELLRASFFPRTDLKTRPPKDAVGREQHFVSMYENFNNGLLNELIELEGEIREADPESVLGKGPDFVVGAGESTAFSA
jgi:hypothetical protein